MSVSKGLEGYLGQKGFDGQGLVLAEVARALAKELDLACEGQSARGISAAPPLASRLMEVLDRLGAREVDKRRSDEVRAMLAPTMVEPG